MNVLYRNDMENLVKGWVRIGLTRDRLVRRMNPLALYYCAGGEHGYTADFITTFMRIPAGESADRESLKRRFHFTMEELDQATRKLKKAYKDNL